jgi:hypothetical protein
VSYCSHIPGTTAERQKDLANYGFQCTCASCTRYLENSIKHGMRLARYLIGMTGKEELLNERFLIIIYAIGVL